MPYLLNLPSFVPNNSNIFFSGSTFIIEDYTKMANYPQMSLSPCSRPFSQPKLRDSRLTSSVSALIRRLEAE